MTEPATVLPSGPSLLEIKRLVRTNPRSHCYGDYTGSIVDIGDNLIVKYGKYVCFSEVEAMKYVSEHTSLPVPRVVAYYNEPGRRESHRRTGYIVMTRVPGKILRNLLKELDPDQMAVVAADLRKVISELSRLNERGRWGMIGKNGVFHQGYFPFSHSGSVCAPRPASPMADIKSHLLGSVYAYNRKPFVDGAWVDFLDRTFAECDSAFSHGDLCPDSILVDPHSYRITGVINWGWAGWYPFFWDSFTAFNTEHAGAYYLEERRNWHEIYTGAIEMHEDRAIGLHLLMAEVREDRKVESIYIRCECCDA